LSLASVGLAAMLLLTVLSTVRAVRFANYRYGTDLSPENVLTFGEVVELSLQTPSDLSREVRPWSACPEVTSLRVGATVATDGSLFPHLVSGARLERRLAEPIGQQDTITDLLREIADRKADYLVFASDSPNTSLAAQVPDRLSLIAAAVCSVGRGPQNVYRVVSRPAP